MDEKDLFNKYGYVVEFVFNTKEDIDVSKSISDCFARFIDRELQKCK